MFVARREETRLKRRSSHMTKLGSWPKSIHNRKATFELQLSPTPPHQLPRIPPNKTHNMGSVVLPHLVTGWHVDQAIMSEEERLVIIRFGRDWDPDCMRQDEVLYRKNPVLCHLAPANIISRYRRPSQELCRHLRLRSRPSP